jgi:ketosteroid isomerase-like protein
VSHENVEIVCRAFIATSGGDPAVVEYDHLAEWDMTGVAGWPEKDVYRGSEIPAVDVAAVMRDADSLATWVEAHAPLFHEDFESVFRGLIGGGETHTGIDGAVAAWSNWLAAWTTYRITPSEAIDCGDQVVVCYEVLACPKGSTGEVKLNGADVWTVRDGKIARWEAYPSRRAALKAVGLSE